MTKISDERLDDAEWLEHAARYFEKRDTGGEDMAFWANVANAERCRSISQSLRAQGGVRVKDALRIAEKFSQEYEWDDGESGHHVPSEFERLMMLDMLNGLFADDVFLSSLEASPAPVSDAARDVLAERERQKAVEGWTPEHDDAHADGALAEAAAGYAEKACGRNGDPQNPPRNWPWDLKWWKPGNPRRMLVKAGALIIAEIERLDRAALAAKGGQ